MVFGAVLNPAARMVEQATILDRRRRPLPLVERLCAGVMDDRPPGLTRRHAQVDVLVVEEETLVEASEFFEQLPPYQEKRSHDLVNRPRVAMVPFGEEVRRHPCGTKPVQKQGLLQQRGGGRSARATALNATLHVEQLDP